MKIISIKKNVVSQKEIETDRKYKEEINSQNIQYMGGYSKDFTGHIVTVEYTNSRGLKQQYEKNLMKNSKGYYINKGGKRLFVDVEDLLHETENKHCPFILTLDNIYLVKNIDGKEIKIHLPRKKN